MKKLITLSSLIMSLWCAANTQAASDMHLKISDSKGSSRVVSCPDGRCSLSSLDSGSYQVQVCDASGAPLVSSFSFGHSVVSPRDSASGMATGKRTHKPLSLTKRVDKSSPQLFSFVVVESGSSVSFAPLATEVTAPLSSVSGGKVSVQDLSVTR